MSGEGGDVCVCHRASGFLQVLQRGPGSRSKGQGGRTQIHQWCQGSPVPALLFPEDEQAVGMGGELSGQPLCSQCPC